MNVLIRGARMPLDCPMCPMAHFDVPGRFRGCEIVPGKKHAMEDPLYADSSGRPDWCPLIEIPEQGAVYADHGCLWIMEDGKITIFPAEEGQP